MKSPASDPQRERVYQIEEAFSGAWVHARTPRSNLLDLLDDVGKYYQLTPPRLKVVKRLSGGSSGCYGQGVIELSRAGSGTNPMVLLHETAHWLIDELFEDETIEDHGPEFVILLIHLFDTYQIIPAAWYRQEAKRLGVRVGRRYRPCAFR
jgi:hypothetical protein